MLTAIRELELGEYVTRYADQLTWVHRMDRPNLLLSLIQQVEQLDQLTVLQTGRRMRLLAFLDERAIMRPVMEVPAGPDSTMIYTHTYDLRSCELNHAYRTSFPEVMILLDLGEGPRTFPILRCASVDNTGADSFQRWLRNLRFDMTSHLLGAKSKAVAWREVEEIGPLNATLLSQIAMEHRHHIAQVHGHNDVWSAYWTWAQEAHLECHETWIAESQSESLMAVRPVPAAVKVVPGIGVCNVDNIAFTLRPEFKPYSLALTGLATVARHTVFSQIKPRDLNLGTNLHGDFPYKEMLGELDHQPVWSFPTAPPLLNLDQLLVHLVK